MSCSSVIVKHALVPDRHTDMTVGRTHSKQTQERLKDRIDRLRIDRLRIDRQTDRQTDGQRFDRQTSRENQTHTVNRGRLTDKQRIDQHMQTEKQNVEEEYLL